MMARRRAATSLRSAHAHSGGPVDPVSIIFIVLGAIVVIALLWGVATYNGFVRLRNLVQEAWRPIDVELHRRHDLIPNLVDTVKGYAARARVTSSKTARSCAAPPLTVSTRFGIRSWRR